MSRKRSLEESETRQQQEQEEQPSSVIVRFYRDGASDTLNRTLAEMLQYSDPDMEECHDHMQWMFPLHEPSMFASQYEILTPRDVEELRASEVARHNMLAAATHFRAFLGVGQPIEPEKWVGWAYNGNHNLLRVTRALRSLRLFGLDEEAQELYKLVMHVAESEHLHKVTVQYWTSAVEDPPTAPLRRPTKRPVGHGQCSLEMFLERTQTDKA